MTNIVNTGNASVDALAEMSISGNVTPVNWYKTILRENGKPYLLAICVLSEIVYWYRPVEVRDEHSGMTIGYRKKFREDLLQKTYNDFAEQFGESRRSVKAAFDRLEEIGVIRREFRNIETNSGMVLNNVMYIDLCVDRLYTCTYLDIPGDDEDVENTGEEIQKQAENQANKPVTKFCTSSYKTLYDPPTKFCNTPYKTSYDPPAKFCNTLPQNDVPPHTKFCKTNTENTTENTEEITYPIIPSGTGVKTDTMDRMDEVRSFIKDNIDYDVLLQCHPTEKMDINELVELMVETIAVKQPVIRINKYDFPYDVVRSRLEKIDFHTMEYVLECLRNNTTKVRNIRSYMLTTLYNAPVTCSNYYKAEVNHGVTVVSQASVVAPTVQKILDVVLTWTIDAAGRIGADIAVKKDEEFPDLPRFGVRMFLDKKLTDAGFFGMGPQESYRDKHRAASHGLYRLKVSDMHEDYIRPQENGSHYDCDYVELGNSQYGITAVAEEDTFSFNASFYTQEELEEKAHNYELIESDSTVFCLDYAQNGIGSNSCGPDVLEAYRFDDRLFRFRFTLVPYVKG